MRFQMVLAAALLALSLNACADFGKRTHPVAMPTPVPLSQAEAGKLLEEARRSYDAAALQTAAHSLSACAFAAEPSRDCAVQGAEAAWLLSLVQETEGKKKEGAKSAMLALRFAEAAVKGLTPTAETRALLADACMRKAWLGGFDDGMVLSLKAFMELSHVVSPTAQSVQVQKVLGRQQFYLAAALGGDLPMAVQTFGRIRELEPADDLNLYFLGAAQAQTRKKKEARASFEEALARNPANPMALKALKALDKP
jgi:tetratricopeptide (TPR) repeat protein